jgi:hypothetical protein
LKNNSAHNLKNNSKLILGIACALVANSALAQNDSIKKAQNKQRINSMLNKVDRITSYKNTKPAFDSLVTVNKTLQQQVREQADVIQKLKQQLAATNNEVATLTAVKPTQSYIVVGAYHTLSLAERKQKQRKLSLASFQIIPSKAKHWYYIVTPVSSNQDAKSILTTIKSTIEKGAWVYKVLDNK